MVHSIGKEVRYALMNMPRFMSPKLPCPYLDTKKDLAMRNLLLGTCCVVAIGCGMPNTPATSHDANSDAPTSVTAQRPVNTEYPPGTRPGLEGAPADVQEGQPATDLDRPTLTDPVDRTNTGINERDRADNAKTPFDQHENSRDIDITAKIREQIVDTEMSINAQNVKIVTEDGKVTLRGPVANEDEKKQIEDIASTVAGAENVTNQLEVQDE